MSTYVESYAAYCKGISTKGSARYEAGPLPGECCVEYDSTRTFYKIPRGLRKGFRQWVKWIWGAGMNGTPLVTGAWPYYTVEKS